MMKDSIGIDVSKDHLDVHCLGDGRAVRFGNDAAGFRKLRAWLPKASGIARVVYEATGPYHAALERRFGGELPLVKVNPLQARRFAQSTGSRAKTDAVDARMLVQMGAALNLAPQAPISETLRELRELQVARQAMIKDKTRFLNRIKTQMVAFVVKQSKARLALIERQLRDIDLEIRSRIDAEKPLARAFEIISSIPGLGAVSTAAVLVECPEIGTLNRKQMASLAGLAPMTRQSGQWKGNAFIQGGRHHLRGALYMPAIVAMRFNPDLKAKYQALRKAGKPAKVAITALMRKLIELANTLVKADRLWARKAA